MCVRACVLPFQVCCLLFLSSCIYYECQQPPLSLTLPARSDFLKNLFLHVSSRMLAARQQWCGWSSQQGVFLLPEHQVHKDNDAVDNNTPRSPAQQLDALVVRVLLALLGQVEPCPGRLFCQF